MEKYQYQSRVVREYVAQGVEEGREEGRELGLRKAILEFARARLDELPLEYEQALADIHDESTLTAVVGELGRARERAEVVAVFERLRNRTASE